MNDQINGMAIMSEINSQAMQGILADIDKKALCKIVGVPYKEPEPPPPQPYDTSPLHDALKADGLGIGVATQHGHGCSEEIPYLYYKKNSWFSLSADAYTELVRLAKIGLLKIEKQMFAEEVAKMKADVSSALLPPSLPDAEK